jgi:IclR family transcriptional regulator, KDG regulon repressor
MADKADYSISIVNVTIDLMEFLLESGQKPQNISEVSRQVNITRSRAFRILKTLEARGYVEFDKDIQGYRLGLKLLELGEGVREFIDLRRIAEPFLRQLAQKTGDVALLVVLRNNVAVCIDRYQGSFSLQGGTQIGVPLPLHVGASPKLLLANLPESDREKLIAEMEFTPYTPYTITNPDELRQRLQEILIQGYSIDIEDFEIGINAIGAPVRDYKGNVVAGVTLTTPAARWNEDRKQKLVEIIVETANQISERLKFNSK